MKNDVCFSFRWSLFPFIILIVCNLTNFIYRLFRQSAMNGVRFGFYLRTKCIYIRPERLLLTVHRLCNSCQCVLENIWGFICPMEGTKMNFLFQVPHAIAWNILYKDGNKRYEFNWMEEHFGGRDRTAKQPERRIILPLIAAAA